MAPEDMEKTMFLTLMGTFCYKVISFRLKNAGATYQRAMVAVNYFTKWVEAVSYASVTRKVVIKFIKKEIIYRYRLPSKIITDNATNLNNKMMREMCEEFKIQHHNSTPYRPKMNGAVEAVNKNIKKIIQKMTVSYKD